MRSKTIAIKVKIALLSALFIFIYLIIFDFYLLRFSKTLPGMYWQSQKMALIRLRDCWLPACQPGNQGKHKK